MVHVLGLAVYNRTTLTGKLNHNIFLQNCVNTSTQTDWRSYRTGLLITCAFLFTYKLFNDDRSSVE